MSAATTAAAAIRAAEAVTPRPFFDDGTDTHPTLPAHLRFGDLRGLMAALPPGEAGNAAAAKGIFAWHETHRFCANCGAGSEIVEAGWKRACPACGAQHFPRTDPVVIMLITHGNSVLLGRSAARVIQDRLMIEARRDLVYTSMSISRISFRLGFADPAYFSRYFLRETGKTPRAFRLAERTRFAAQSSE